MCRLEVDSGVIAYIDNYNNAMKTGNRFSLDKFVDKKLVSHLTARRITLIPPPFINGRSTIIWYANWMV